MQLLRHRSAVSAPFCAALCCLCLCVSSCHRNTITSHYRDWTEIRKRGADHQGWIPSFLPASATNIFEQHNLDADNGNIAFSAKPSDLASLARGFWEIPTNRLSGVGPQLVTKAGWWPIELRKNRPKDLVEKEGFKIYTKVNSNPMAHQQWFLAINQKKGIGYVWNRFVWR